MSVKQTFRTLLVFAVTIALVASVTVTPVAAEDDLTLGSDGVSLGDEDGVSISSSDADAGVNVSADADTDGINVEVEGSGGGTSGGVECNVNSSIDGNPCSTSGGSGDVTPSVPRVPGGELPDGELPEDPSVPSGELPDGELPEAPSLGGGSGGSDAAQAVEDGIGQAPNHLSTDQLPLDTAPLPADPSAGVTRPGVSVGEDSATVYTFYRAFQSGQGTYGLVMVTASPNETYMYTNPQLSNQDEDYRGRNTVRVRPEDGTIQTNVRETGPNRTVTTMTSCDLSAGWLRLCGIHNDAPVTSDDLPKDQIPDIPKQVENEAGVSKGLLFLVADTAVQEPSSIMYLTLGQVGSNTPEQSPINPANPPYNPNQPPINLANPQGSFNPDWWVNPRQPTIEQDGAILYGNGNAELNDRMYLRGYHAGFLSSDGDQFSVLYLRGSDGQNQYQSKIQTSDQTLQTTSDGPVGGSATLGPDQQTGSIGMALGGQEYERSFGGDGGGGIPSAPGLPSGIPGSLPVDPSQPPSSPV